MGKVRREEKGKKLMGNERGRKEEEKEGRSCPKGKLREKMGQGNKKEVREREKDFFVSSIGRK